MHTVIDVDCHIKLWVEFLKHFSGYFDTGDYALFLHNETLYSTLSIGDSA